MALPGSGNIDLSAIQTETGAGSLNAAGAVAGFQSGGTAMTEFYGWSNIPPPALLLDPPTNAREPFSESSPSANYYDQWAAASRLRWLSYGGSGSSVTQIFLEFDILSITGNYIDAFTHVETRAESTAMHIWGSGRHVVAARQTQTTTPFATTASEIGTKADEVAAWDIAAGQSLPRVNRHAALNGSSDYGSNARYLYVGFEHRYPDFSDFYLRKVILYNQ